MTWAHTSRGRALDMLAPTPEDIDLTEIAGARFHREWPVGSGPEAIGERFDEDELWADLVDLADGCEL